MPSRFEAGTCFKAPRSGVRYLLIIIPPMTRECTPGWTSPLATAMPASHFTADVVNRLAPSGCTYHFPRLPNFFFAFLPNRNPTSASFLSNSFFDLPAEDLDAGMTV